MLAVRFAKGTVYEHIVGNTFRGELGQFFTHRNIVEFMVRLVGVDEQQVVYDPSCGSGGVSHPLRPDPAGATSQSGPRFVCQGAGTADSGL